jgi:hypothetical protein
MATSPKLGPVGINPEVKSWIDNVIVPTMVKEFLASERSRGDVSNFDAPPVVECSDIKASPERFE